MKNIYCNIILKITSIRNMKISKNKVLKAISAGKIDAGFSAEVRKLFDPTLTLV